jgi:hypothetical protein
MNRFFLDYLNLHILNSISIDQLLDEQKKYYDTLQTYWRDNNFLTTQWWFLVICKKTTTFTNFSTTRESGFKSLYNVLSFNRPLFCCISMIFECKPLS